MRVSSNGKNEGNVTDAIWLRCGNYQVLPLNPRLRGHIPELECAIQRGISARPDLQRQDFYILELRSGWAYIHVRENVNTVYLVAYSSSKPPHASPARISSEMIEEDAQVAGRFLVTDESSSNDDPVTSLPDTRAYSSPRIPFQPFYQAP
jgi:hypothetical protein